MYIFPVSTKPYQIDYSGQFCTRNAQIKLNNMNIYPLSKESYKNLIFHPDCNRNESWRSLKNLPSLVVQIFFQLVANLHDGHITGNSSQGRCCSLVDNIFSFKTKNAFKNRLKDSLFILLKIVEFLNIHTVLNVRDQLQMDKDCKHG